MQKQEANQRALSNKALKKAQRRADVGDRRLRSVENRGGLAGYQNEKKSKGNAHGYAAKQNAYSTTKRRLVEG